MRSNPCLVVAIALLAACSRGGAPLPETDLADAQAQADEATAADFGAPSLDACGLLSRDEVTAAIGALAGDPESPPENAADTAEGRCIWRAVDGRSLSVAASDEGGAERIAAIQPSSAPGVSANWDEARLQGCCLLHAVKDEAMVSLDFSLARIDVAQAARLVERALGRVHEPFD